MRTDELDYPLPLDAVATTPASPREHARLMVVSRSDASVQPIHARIADLPDFLRPHDLLIFNASRVLPARFKGRNLRTGGAVEGLYLRAPSSDTWEVMLKARRLRENALIELDDSAGAPSGVRFVLLHQAAGDEPGSWLVRVEGPPDALERVGLTPLPPYILAARRRAHLDIADADDRRWYQTAFAADAGSVAAPTAGLHFTHELLARLSARAVEHAHVLLHVGTGTFRPVETETIEAHPMHAEWCSMPEALAERIRARTGRVISVGTTSARTVESYFALDPALPWPEHLSTRLLITPGYTWRALDGLLTNFHLPRSTLMAMVAAMLPGGVEHLKALYAEAIARGYRFYSYGDAMLIL
ncbi:MAG: tRNA preQ1(34) S-adenosylmethionine ribosyltransferase-isomerase QueA [Phycisphaeraceae bacterium]|nr:tRNA preQ1(34) S-adenosylmethionine ribosyltransferase-isomerase QueA [Phycisphaeraceae bacterium]MCW5754666.1 tRNA preQ1(34) S-adenosylmethionine ribosyltransferase-isomerase QueA [Phycisphaeraceae bacterium]